jgi:hypothetical protein
MLVNKRSELRDVATAMLKGQFDLIEGVRKICVLRHEIGDPDNKVFMPIRAIESETDHFPVGAIRTQCSASYLQRMDEELNQYLADTRQDILASCREIIRTFS